MSIIDHIKSHFNPEYISELGIELGESESGISKATKGLIPLVMNGLANLAEHPDVVNAVYNSHSEINEATGISKIQDLLLEENVNLLSSIEAYSKVSRESTIILFQKVLERTLLTFGKHCADQNIEPSRISSVLKEQKGIIPGSLPAGFPQEALGLNETIPLEKEIDKASNYNKKESSKTPVEISTNQPISKKKKTSFWTWLLPLLLIGLASWFLWNEYLNTLTTPVPKPKPLKQIVKKDTIEAIKQDSVIVKDTIQKTIKTTK